MILDIAHPTQPDLFPCRLFDADGVEILLATKADTETGEVIVLQTYTTGKFIANAQGTEILRDVKHFKPPLRVEKIAEQGNG
jgi:hypothetical protein